MEAIMNFRISGLPAAEFQPLFNLSGDELRSRDARRVVADAKPGFPCRVSLADAEVGEELILLNHTHQAVRSPYRASGPVFVRRAATQAFDQIGNVPEQLCVRLLSLRAYDSTDSIIQADVVDGREVERLLSAFLADPKTAYIHIHFARHGCYAARAERA